VELEDAVNTKMISMCSHKATQPITSAKITMIMASNHQYRKHLLFVVDLNAEEVVVQKILAQVLWPAHLPLKAKLTSQYKNRMMLARITRGKTENLKTSMVAIKEEAEEGLDPLTTQKVATNLVTTITNATIITKEEEDTTPTVEKTNPKDMVKVKTNMVNKNPIIAHSEEAIVALNEVE
jgi:hypothetical protein